MKIVYCINSISHVGGIARTTIAKSNALAAIPGNEVWIAYTDIDAENPAPALPLDRRVHLIDLGIRYYDCDRRGLYFRMRASGPMRRLHRNALEKELKKIRPDIVVSVGQSEKYFIPGLRLGYRPVFIREFHYQRNYRLQSARSLIGKFMASLTNLYDFRFMLPRYDAIAVLTAEDMGTNWRHTPVAKKTHVIPNPLTSVPEIRSPLSAREVVTVGRLDYPKNHTSLLRAWEKVVARHPDWTLTIYGEGEYYSALKAQINHAGTDGSVRLPGSVADVAGRLAEASIFAFSSRFEGFGLVLIEAASVGLPVVSYACPCGPRDIFTDGENGILVPPDDEQALADGICRLIENPQLRCKMGQAAFSMSQRYYPEIIAGQWMELFRKLLAVKK